MLTNSKRKRLNIFIIFLLALALVSSYSSFAFTGAAPGIETTASTGAISASNYNYNLTAYSSMSPVGHYTGNYEGYFGISSYQSEAEDNTTIHLTLISPINNAGSKNESVVFKILTSGADISYCDLLIDSIPNVTIYSPQHGYNNIEAHISLGKHNWSVRCYNMLDNQFNSSTRNITILQTDEFDDITTDFNNTDISNIEDLTIAKSGNGKIVFPGTTDLSNGISLNRNIIFGRNSVYLNSTALPVLNKSALLTIYNVNITYPVILRDGQACLECNILSKNQNITFSVNHFSNYSVSENSHLSIWDTTDLESKYSDELILFYANYSNRTSGEPITSADCNITFEDTGTTQMSYDSDIYQYNRTFLAEGIYYFNISCNGESLEYAKLSGRDYVSIIHINAPQGANITFISSERGQSSVLESQNSQQGNLTPLNIASKAITSSWQGYFGNISGKIILTSPNENSIFYDWSLEFPTGEVYATRASDVNFATVNCTNENQVEQEENFIGHNSTESDSVTNTFNQNIHPTFKVGIVNISNDTCKSTNIYVNGTAQSESFYEVLLSDDADNIIYASIIDQNKIGFDENRHDFQMLVGENGHGNTEITTYYFFVELT